MDIRSKIDHSLFLTIVGIAAWVVPGAGHLLIKERKRAIIIFVTITALFTGGLYVGSVGVVNPAKAWFAYVPQMMATPATSLIAKMRKPASQEQTNTEMDPQQAQDMGYAQALEPYESYGEPGKVGQIYTIIAGMLNLLCILSAVYMAHSGRGEMIGHEEDEDV